MKTYLDCIPCFFKQAIEASRIAGANQKTQKKILDKLSKVLSDISLTSSPPEMGRVIYKLVKEMTFERDPYKKIKDKSNKLALRFYNRLKDKVSRSNDRLLTAVELAIAGNIIDYGVKNSLDVGKELNKILNGKKKAPQKKDKVHFDYFHFKQVLSKSENILYLADNAGETVFDRILIEEINKIWKNKNIIYAVKEEPVINDALAEDAYKCGIDKIAEIISCGSDAPGTVLSLCSKDFLKIYKQSDMIISKGQGNFEALSQEEKLIFFLFMAKCPVVAKDVGCEVGDIVLLSNANKI
ncbi:MAG: ARMT1-like domain-containing protein [Candidatus Zapsychrus exili]|nr:ARMT1-like domain-containing protein [Candidatus Zapsychrus exili]